MQISAGHIEDEDGFIHEVWVETHENGRKEHVYGMCGNKQTFDFPFGQPDKGCDLCEAAQIVASSEVTSAVSLPILVVVAE